MAADQFRHQQPRDHAAVAIDEIAEIVMRRHFPAIDGILIAHRLLYEGMPGARLHRPSAALADQFLRIPDDTRIVNDGRIGILFKECLGQKPHDILTIDKTAGMVQRRNSDQNRHPTPRRNLPRLRARRPPWPDGSPVKADWECLAENCRRGCETGG